MAEEAAQEKPVEEKKPEDLGKLKLFLILNLLFVMIGIGVSVFTFIKFSKPQVSDVAVEEGHEEKAEEGHGAPAEGGGEHGKKAGGGEHGGGGGGEALNKMSVDRLFVNLAGSNAQAIVNVSFELNFTKESDMGFVNTRTSKIRDLVISLISSKTTDQMGSVKGREELKDQMKVAIDAVIQEHGKIEEILITNFYLSSGG